MKKFKFFIIPVLFISFYIFNTTSTYAASGWQLIDTVYIGSGTQGKLDGAKGGNARICLKDAFGGANVRIWSDNGSTKTIVKNFSFMNNNSCYSFDTRPYVDGADDNAEFIVETSRHIVGTIKFELWD